MNCSIGDEVTSARWLQADAAMLSPTYSSCVLYSAALAAHGGPRLNCLKMLGGLDPGYDCNSPPSECVDALRAVNGGKDCCGCVATKGQAGPGCSATCASLAVRFPQCGAQVSQCPNTCPHEKRSAELSADPQPAPAAATHRSASATGPNGTAVADYALQASHGLVPRRRPAYGSGLASRGPGAACAAALAVTCSTADKGSACRICTGQHQRALMIAGCSNDDLTGYCAVPATAPECGWYNSSTDAGRYCKLCKSTVWWPCKACAYTPTVPQCAPCALPLAICPKIGCW